MTNSFHLKCGNTWEPIIRWLKLDSRIFRETLAGQEYLCDLESLAEIYNYRSIR